MQWISEHWQTVATVGGIAAVLISTVLVRVVEWYGDGHPALRRGIGFALSLLALVPTRGGVSAGVRVAVGRAEVQVPLASWSEDAGVSRVADRVRRIREGQL